MGLLDTLNELGDATDEVTIENGEIKDVEKAEEPEKEEVAEEEDHPKSLKKRKKKPQPNLTQIKKKYLGINAAGRKSLKSN